MIELCVGICVALVASQLVWVIARNLLLTFKWSVLGIKPRILDEKLVTSTVELWTNSQVAHDVVELGLTQEEQGIYRTHLRQLMRNAIEQYIDSFTRK